MTGAKCHLKYGGFDLQFGSINMTPLVVLLALYFCVPVSQTLLRKVARGILRN
jgi:hypothetical protein